MRKEGCRKRTIGGLLKKDKKDEKVFNETKGEMSNVKKYEDSGQIVDILYGHYGTIADCRYCFDCHASRGEQQIAGIL
jgi:hypothetical protein